MVPLWAAGHSVSHPQARTPPAAPCECPHGDGGGYWRESTDQFKRSNSGVDHCQPDLSERRALFVGGGPTVLAVVSVVLMCGSYFVDMIVTHRAIHSGSCELDQDVVLEPAK